jgi:hypothetical protein
MQNLSLMSFLLCTISDINVAGGTNPSDEPDFIPMHVLSELKFFCGILVQECICFLKRQLKY